MSAFILFCFRHFYNTVVDVQYSSTSATTSLLFIFFSKTNRNGGSATERATQLKREHFLEKKAGERANLRLSRITVTVQWSITIRGQKKEDEDEKRRRPFRPFDIYRAEGGGGGELKGGFLFACKCIGTHKKAVYFWHLYFLQGSILHRKGWTVC